MTEIITPSDEQYGAVIYTKEELVELGYEVLTAKSGRQYVNTPSLKYTKLVEDAIGGKCVRLAGEGQSLGKGVLYFIGQSKSLGYTAVGGIISYWIKRIVNREEYKQLTDKQLGR